MQHRILVQDSKMLGCSLGCRQGEGIGRTGPTGRTRVQTPDRVRDCCALGSRCVSVYPSIPRLPFDSKKWISIETAWPQRIQHPRILCLDLMFFFFLCYALSFRPSIMLKSEY
ncbi:hypothetical protein DAI22_03g018050 [Oryza sativa Japonica Group]|nr:hypothetical protein DAI22_03g018050 [Oryza sativa Japonica Group]